MSHEAVPAASQPEAPGAPGGPRTRAVLMDRFLGSQRPSLASAAAVTAIEAVPFLDRIEARSTLDAIAIGAARDPLAPALHFLPQADPAEPGLVIPHQVFLQRVRQAANAFHALGLPPDGVVSLLLPLVPQSFYALFGAEAAGIANPVNTLLEPHQLAEILNAAGTRIVVTLGPSPDSDIWDKVQRIRGQVPSLQAILTVGTPPPAQPGVHEFDRLLAAQPGDRLVSARPIVPGDVAAYFHTGGTTGTPKLVRHTHANQLFQAWAVNLMLGQPGRPLLFGLPLYHVGGALTQGLSTLASGGCIVVLSASGWRNAAAVRHVWKLVERFRPTVFGGVPTVLAAAAAIPSEGVDTSSVRVVSGGGSGIPVAVGQALQQRFDAPVLEVYGMTETSSVHTISYQDRPLRLGSVGHPVPYARVRVVRLDAQGGIAADCAVDEIGVVIMSGPGVFSGYLSAEHNRGAFAAPGWVNSGDLGRLDAEGYLWITGRAKDLVIRGGHNIDPLPIEELLYRHPAVALAAVIGQPDAYAGELPLAYVQLKPGLSVDPLELLAHVRAGTPERAAVPVEVRLLDAMPLTGVGKVFKPQLRWDAAQRVFERLLAPLAGDAARIAVLVGADGTHGTLATVTLSASDGSALPAERARALAADVERLLGPFVIRHVVLGAD